MPDEISLERVTPDGSLAPTSPEHLWQRVLEGEMFVATRGLQGSGFFSRIQALAFEAVEEAGGPGKARQVREQGFEGLHRVLGAAEVILVTRLLYAKCRPLLPELVSGFGREVLGLDRPFYFERQANVRFHLPYDAWVGDRAAYLGFGKEYGEGKLSPHNPHRDSWYRCPENGINVWAALGHVVPGNGLCVYPEVYGRSVAREPNGAIRRDQQLGKILNFSLGPGSALIFHGEQLHSSELNHTDITRFVLSFRLTPERPRFRTFSNHRYLRSSRGRWLSACVEPAGRLWRNAMLGLEKLRSPSRVQEVPPPAQPTMRPEILVSNLEEGALLPLSSGLCVTRFHGRPLVFPRFCPHEGGDLSTGYVREGRLFCPWHHLPFDLRTGASPCRAMRPLSMREYSEERSVVKT